MVDMTKTELQKVAEEAYQCFTTKTRDNGDVFFTLKDGSPEWVKDLVYAAHHGWTDFLPDDYRYRWTFGALEFIADHQGDDPMLESAEFADLAVDTYTNDRLRWLSSNFNRPGYCDEAVSNGLVDARDGMPGIIDLIGVGQYMEAEEVYSLVLNFLNDRIES